MWRVIFAFKMGYIAFKTPSIMFNFESIIKLYELIIQVAVENKPYMTKLAQMTPEGEKQDLVTVWAGSGIGSEPLERIEHLVKENRLLKKLIDKED